MMRSNSNTFKVVILLSSFMAEHFVQGEGPEIFQTCGKGVNLELTTGATYGILTTPNYPTKTNLDGTYPPNLDCDWYLTGARTTLVQFKLWGLSIQPGRGGSNVTCDYDYAFVQIDSAGTKKYCGTYKPKDAFQGMGSLKIRFHSDDRINYRGFQATFQQTVGYDPCDPTPCKSGRCHFNIKTLLPDCICQPGISGRFCESDIDECLSHPCLNRGRCEQSEKVLNKFTCTCPPGFKGYRCEIEKESPCASNPCQYNGTCIAVSREKFVCKCMEAYKGIMCEIKTGCGNPGIPHLHEFKRFLFGSTLIFSCMENYVRRGAVNTTCQRDGTWSDERPDCRLEGVEDDGSRKLSLWSKAMIGLGLMFVAQLILFVTWMVHKSPWAFIERATAFATNFTGNKTAEEGKVQTREGSVRSTSVCSVSDGSMSQY